SRLARPGPPSSEYTRRQVIDELTSAAAEAEPPVRDVTGLVTDGVVPAARIVDRPEWVRAAAESVRVMTNGTDKPRGFFTGRITGAQTGAVLAFVASGILGQYDPFAAAEKGCLLLVYPNVIAVERQLQVEPSDFRLWVCLHEVTHRVQFTANRWLSGYMSQALGVLTQETGEDMGQVLSRLADFVRNRGNGAYSSESSIVDAPGILGLVRGGAAAAAAKALVSVLGAWHAGGGPRGSREGCGRTDGGAVGAPHRAWVRRASPSQATAAAAVAARTAGHRRQAQPI